MDLPLRIGRLGYSIRKDLGPLGSRCLWWVRTTPLSNESDNRVCRADILLKLVQRGFGVFLLTEINLNLSDDAFASQVDCQSLRDSAKLTCHPADEDVKWTALTRRTHDEQREVLGSKLQG